MNQTVDTVSSAGAAYAGAAIGTLIGGPIGTVIGAGVGVAASYFLNMKWGKSDDSSLTGWAKSGLKNLFGG